jgi:hypothetical protein
VYDDNIYIDFGYTHVTIVFEKKHEITHFDTFTIGTKMLMDMIGDAYAKYSYTQVESLLMRSHPSEEERVHREAITREYLSYAVDVLGSVIHSTSESIKTKNIFVS